MEAWGADVQYVIPKFDKGRSQIILGFAYVSNAAGARFLSKEKTSKQVFHEYQRAFWVFKSRAVHVRLNSGQRVKLEPLIL